MRPHEVHGTLSKTTPVKWARKQNWGEIAWAIPACIVLGALAIGMVCIFGVVIFLPFYYHYTNIITHARHPHTFSTYGERVWWGIGDGVVFLIILAGFGWHWMKDADRWPWEIVATKHKELRRG